jgi:hypothetical protein
MKNIFLKTVFFLLTLFLFSNFQLFAHCDGLDGPVVKAAKKSLETGNINYTLIWVGEEFTEELNHAFQKTLNVRTLSPEAKELADNYFFETVVRLHRIGEGESFTGLKPAGRDLGPAIPAADLAIQTNSLDQLQKLLPQSSGEKLIGLFENVMRTKNFETNDIAAGREFVDAYVHFIHYAETQYEQDSEMHNHDHEL